MADLRMKQSWAEPKVVVFGNVESLTLAHVNKTTGGADGLTFNGTPIQYTSA